MHCSFYLCCRVQITFTAKGGTLTRVFDQSAIANYSLTGTSEDGVAIRQLIYDNIQPYNCHINSSDLCNQYSVQNVPNWYTLSHYSTTNREISISNVEGFIDEYSRVLTYTYTVYPLEQGAANGSLQENFGSVNVVDFNTSVFPLSITLPEVAGPYSIVVRVLDLALNMRLSRRLVVSDNSSLLYTDTARPPTSPNSMMQNVPSLNPEFVIFWQNDPSALLEYQWENYFMNDHIVNSPWWLNPVLSFNNQGVEFVYSAYDDNTPPMAVQGTMNAHGVVTFEYNLVRYQNGEFVYNVTEAPTENWSIIPDVATKYSQAQSGSVSGDAFVLWINAIDVFDHSIIRKVILYTDFTPPMIIDLGLSKFLILMFSGIWLFYKICIFRDRRPGDSICTEIERPHKSSYIV